MATPVVFPPPPPPPSVADLATENLLKNTERATSIVTRYEQNVAKKVEERAARQTRANLEALPDVRSLLHLMDNLRSHSFTNRQVDNAHKSVHFATIARAGSSCQSLYDTYLKVHDNRDLPASERAAAIIDLQVCVSSVSCPNEMKHYDECLRATRDSKHQFCRAIKESVRLCAANKVSSVLKAALSDDYKGRIS